jgi:hypothetical protein
MKRRKKRLSRRYTVQGDPINGDYTKLYRNCPAAPCARLVILDSLQNAGGPIWQPECVRMPAVLSRCHVRLEIFVGHDIGLLSYFILSAGEGRSKELPSMKVEAVPAGWESIPLKSVWRRCWKHLQPITQIL